MFTDIRTGFFPLPDCRLVSEFDPDLAQDSQGSLVDALKLLGSDRLYRPDAVLDG
ncbi:hypothetical protein SLT36_25800 [Aminobacter sp. BA135]